MLGWIRLYVIILEFLIILSRVYFTIPGIYNNTDKNMILQVD